MGAQTSTESIRLILAGLKHSAMQGRSDGCEYRCERCADTGVVPVLKTGEEVTWSEVAGEVVGTRGCTCVEQRRRERMLASSHMTKHMADLTFETFEVRGRPQCVHAAYHTAVEYVEAFDVIRETDTNSILLLGAPGTGKTHLLLAVCNKLTARGTLVQYFSWVDGCRELRNDFDRFHERIHHMQTVDVLYIDDLYKGRARPTDYERELLFSIINYRYLNRLPVMMSSERDLDDLLDIDEAIARRMIERAQGYSVVMGLMPEESDVELDYSLVRQHR